MSPLRAGILGLAVLVLASLSGEAAADGLRFQSWGRSSSFGNSSIVPPLRPGNSFHSWRGDRHDWHGHWGHRRHWHDHPSVIVVLPPVHLHGGIIVHRSRTESRFVLHAVPRDHVVIIEPDHFDGDHFDSDGTVVVAPVVIGHGLVLSHDRTTGIIVVLPPKKPTRFALAD